MRIGIDGGCLANRRGFGRFARQTLLALAESGSGHEFRVFVDRPSDDSVAIPPPFQRVVVDVTQAPSRAASSTGRRSLRDMLAMSRAVAKAKLDLMFFPSTYSFFPVWGVKRVVVTMHDTLALASPELVFPTWQGRVAWTLKEHAAVRTADRILTVSEAARRDLLRWFRLPTDRVRVVTEGPEAVFQAKPRDAQSDDALARYGLIPRDRFLLYVGGLSPHKNLLRLIEAYSRSQLAGEGVRLIMVGDTGDVFHTHLPELRAEVKRHQVEASVRFTGFVPDSDLVHLYNRAQALVQPSLMEGFGLPPVEAMACGTPVLASRAGSLPEVVGDAGLFFDPTDIDEMARAMRRIFERPALRAELAVKASMRATLFTWRASARGILDVFESLDSKPRALSAKAWRMSA